MPREIVEPHIAHDRHTKNDIEDRLTVLKENESARHYKCSDYLRFRRVAGQVSISRQWYVKWMYNVVDHFRIGRDVVSYAAAYMDKFASEDHTVLYSKDDFTVLAMTSLYMAVKIFSTVENASALCACNLVLLTEGKFVESDILQMETRMLDTLKWKLYPPASVCFLREYMRLLPYDAVSESNHRAIFRLSKFIIEISVMMYAYITYPSSVKAYAALFTALGCLPETRGVAIELHRIETFRYLKGLVSTRYPSIFDELRLSLADRPPYQDMLAKMVGDGTIQHARFKSETEVDARELLNSPREVVPWWDSPLSDRFI